MQSARIACPCFTRPRFELGLSPRAPQVSAKRVRLSWPIKSQAPLSIPHDVANVCPFMTNLSSSTFARVVVALDLFDDSAMTSSRKDNKFFACLCFSIESSTEVSALVCVHLRRTVAIGTDGFRVERRCLLSLRCLWRWIGTLVLGICAMGWIRDDPARQHGNEMLTLPRQLTQALFVTRKRHLLTYRPHPLDHAAKDPSHSMKSLVIAWPSKQSVLPS